MMAISASGSWVLTASVAPVASPTPPSGCGSSRIGGQVEQKMFRLSISSGCLLLPAVVGSGRRELLVEGGEAGIDAATFDSTALEAALPRKVAHRATTARSSAHRYFLSRVSTASLGARATPGPGSVDIWLLIPIGYADDVGDWLAILARDSKRDGRTGRASAQAEEPAVENTEGRGEGTGPDQGEYSSGRPCHRRQAFRSSRHRAGSRRVFQWQRPAGPDAFRIQSRGM